MNGEVEMLVITVVKYPRDFSTLYCMWESTCIYAESRRKKEKEIVKQMDLSSPKHARMGWRHRRKGRKTIAGQTE